MGISKVKYLHAKMKQSERFKRIDFLKAENALAPNILVSTDVAARGLDIRNVQTVVEYRVNNKESHMHRIGRVARVHDEGACISICGSNNDTDNIFSWHKHHGLAIT